MPIKLFPPKAGRTPYWHIRGTYLGEYVNRSSRTGDRAIAVKLKRQIEDEIERGCYAKPGDPTFASAAIAYMQAEGEKTYLPKLLEHFGETPLKQIGQDAIEAAATALYPRSSGATRNRSVFTPVSAVLRHAGVERNLRRPKGASGARRAEVFARCFERPPPENRSAPASRLSTGGAAGCGAAGNQLAAGSWSSRSFWACRS